MPWFGHDGKPADLNFNFSYGSGDNGNVMGITNNRDTTRSQAFTYDALNRIVTNSVDICYQPRALLG